MHFPKVAALLSLVIAVVYAEITSNCSGVVTIFVPVTAAPVTQTASLPFEVSPSIPSKHGVPSKLEVALDNSTKVTAASADNTTIIHIVPTAPKNSTPAVAEKGLHYSNAENGTKVCLDDQTLSEVDETEKFIKIAPAIANSSAVTISSIIPAPSSNTAPLITTVPLVATVPSVATLSLIATKSFGSLAGFGLNGWNGTFRTLLKEKLVGSANEPAKLPSQQTGASTVPSVTTATDKNFPEVNQTEKFIKIAPAIANSSAVMISSFIPAPSSNTAPLTTTVPLVATVSSMATVSLVATKSFGSLNEFGLNGWNTTIRTLLKEKLAGSANEPAKLLSQQTGVATVPSVTTTALIASKSFGSLTGCGLSGWNATSRTLLRENIVGSVNEPAELPSQRTGVNDNLLTRPGTSAFLPARSSSLNVTNNKRSGQLGSVVVPTIKSVGVSRTKNPDGTALTPPAPVATASDATAQTELVIASERNSAAIYPWNLQLARVRVFPTSSFGPSKISSFEQPRYQAGIPSQHPSVSANLRNTVVLSNSSVRLPVLTRIITSAIPGPSALSTSRVKASTAIFSNTTNATEVALTANRSCTGKANFTIDFDDLPPILTSAEVANIPPIVNPYRKLFFEEGHFGYVSPPRDPFPPVSPPQLAVYRTNLQVNFDGSSEVGVESIGEIGAGPRASDSAYWINAFSLWLGCENVGPSDCVITINGYDSDHPTKVASKTVNQPPCPGLADCKLALIELPNSFRNLSGIHILATVDLKLTTYYIDDVSLGWSNNTCAAQEKRSSTG